MQIQSVKSVNNQKINGKPNFRGVGVTDGLIKFFEGVAKGGAPGEFLMQDVAACGIPRTISSLNRNKEKLGHLNYLAAGETAIREVLTGSSTLVVPSLVILGTSKAIGSANKVSVASIKDYSNIMLNTAKTVDIKTPQIKEAFYTDVFKKIGENLGKKEAELEGFAKSFAKKVLDYEAAPKNSFIKKLLGKQAKDIPTKDVIMGEITDSFARIKKASVKNFDTDFLSAQISKNNADGIEGIVKSLKNYTDDFMGKAVKTPAKTAEAFINKFKNIRVGSRFLMGVATVVLTGLFMTIIPKLYTLSKTNPEGEVNNAQPQNNGEGK